MCINLNYSLALMAGSSSRAVCFIFNLIRPIRKENLNGRRMELNKILFFSNLNKNKSYFRLNKSKFNIWYRETLKFISSQT